MRELAVVPTRYSDDAGKKMSVVGIMNVYSKYARYTVRMKFGYITPAGSDRKVYQGPLVPGPWVFGFPLSTVIDNHGGSAREESMNRAAGIEFDAAIGDRFIVDGRTYELRENNPHSEYPNLELVD